MTLRKALRNELVTEQLVLSWVRTHISPTFLGLIIADFSVSLCKLFLISNFFSLCVFLFFKKNETDIWPLSLSFWIVVSFGLVAFITSGDKIKERNELLSDLKLLREMLCRDKKAAKTYPLTPMTLTKVEEVLVSLASIVKMTEKELDRARKLGEGELKQDLIYLGLSKLISDRESFRQKFEECYSLAAKFGLAKERSFYYRRAGEQIAEAEKRTTEKAELFMPSPLPPD